MIVGKTLIRVWNYENVRVKIQAEKNIYHEKHVSNIATA